MQTPRTCCIFEETFRTEAFFRLPEADPSCFAYNHDHVEWHAFNELEITSSTPVHDHLDKL
jgi:hypothetical protein